MVGRIFDFSLPPFNFHESLKAKNSRLEKLYQDNNTTLLDFIQNGKAPKNKDRVDPFNNEFIPLYEEHCVWGGYPAVVLAASNLERSKIISSIYDNYVLKDIKGLLKLATEKNLYLLSQYLATQIGNILVFHNLGQTSNLNFRKLKKHLNILEETYVCTYIRPFFINRQKELSRNPKVFFNDLGFRNNLLENTTPPEKRSDAGAIIENASFIRLNALFKGINKINYWRTKAGAEVDFVLHFGEKIMPVEIKYSNFEKNKISKSFASFIATFRPARALVLTKNYWGTTRISNTQVLFAPVYFL
jgi:predicted AAA+ superfamily ATPase